MRILHDKHASNLSRINARRVCCIHACNTLKHILQTCTQSHPRTHRRLLMAGVVGGVEAAVAAKKLMVLPVPLSSETREATLTLSMCRSVGKEWWGRCRKTKAVTPVQCGWTCVHLFDTVASYSGCTSSLSCCQKPRGTAFLWSLKFDIMAGYKPRPVAHPPWPPESPWVVVVWSASVKLPIENTCHS